MKEPPPVIIGRVWKFAPEVSDAESPVTKLTWKLDEGSPAGLTVEATTGELNWTPEDSIPVGEALAKLTVTDDGMPAQSTSLELRLDVQDDLALFTKFTGFFAKDDDRRVIFTDQSRGKQSLFRVGDSFTVADVKGTIVLIASKYLIFTSGDELLRLDLGQSLREATVQPNETPDATQPANAGSP